MSGRQLPRHSGWLPEPDKFRDWVRTKLDHLRATDPDTDLGQAHYVIREFHDLIEQTPVIREAFGRMFFQTLQNLDMRGVGQVRCFRAIAWRSSIIFEQVTSYTEMLQAFNSFLFHAPNFNEQRFWGGLIAFPFNATIDWPMASTAGLEVFNMSAVDAQLKKVFDVWAKYLATEDSRDEVLFKTRDGGKTLGWFSVEGIQFLEKDLYSVPPDPFNPAVGPYPKAKFVDAYQCIPNDPTEAYGYTSWDNFFTRKFKKNFRPVESLTDNKVIVAACESDLNRIWLNVKATSQFWIKGQPYSAHDIINHDPEWKNEFGNGSCVFQAFLSARGYHRWNSPVNGTIVKSFVVPGTYFALCPSSDLDPSAPDLSQPYISQVATRGVIFIKADDKDIGLMCFVAVGMAEVSTCEITVDDRQVVKKGDQLGMFHHGGSSHCLLFRPSTATKLKWNPKYISDPPNPNELNKDYEDDGKHHIFLGQKIASV